MQVVLVFSVAMWFVQSWSNTCCLRIFGMTICLPFSTIPSITASSSLYYQYAFMSACSLSLILGHPVIIKPLRHCKWSSCVDTCCICAMDMHCSMSITLCMASILMSISLIGLSFPSTWLCHNNQSAIKISGPGLYIIWTLY